MSDDNLRQLPEPGVILDLDTEERPSEDVKPPFVVKIGGKSITFTDPSELDWTVLAAIQQPGDLINSALSREDRKHIRETELPGWKFNRLMESYYTHYDLEDKIREAQQRQRAFGS